MQRLLVHHDHAARAHDRAGRGQVLVVDRQIQQVLGDAAARWPAGLHGLELLPVGDAAADVVDHVSQRDAHGHLDQAGVVDLAHQREDRRALALLGADAGVPVGAVVDDVRHVAQVLTLLMLVGLPHSPRSAGKGGRGRGSPMRPSIDAISAVSSPQTNAPAPSWMCTSKLNPEPRMFWPSRPQLLRLARPPCESRRPPADIRGGCRHSLRSRRSRTPQSACLRERSGDCLR